jgi:hypothetical protein
MRTIFRVTGLVTLLAAVVLFPTAATGADGVDAQTAFDQLKTLAGTWRGTPEGQGEAEAEAGTKSEVVHEFRISSAGTVVMETMNRGTDDEMINMYHLDGDDLLVTHYCSGGNQPRMRLDRNRSTAKTLVFDFAGGTNLDPAVDGHIHAAKITFVDDEHLDSAWTSHAEGKQAGVMTFHLARAE